MSGRLGDLAVLVDLQLRVDAADVFAAHQADAGNGRAHGKVVPVGPGDLGAAQGAGEHGDFHLDFFGCPVPGLGDHLGENGVVRVGLDPLGADGVSVDVEVRVVHRVVLVRAGGDLAEGRRVEQFAPAEGGLEQVAVAFAAVDAAGADARLGGHAAGPVLGLKCFVGIRLAKVHSGSPHFFEC